MRRYSASLFTAALIRNETECQEASKRLGDKLKRLDEHGARLKEAGLGTIAQRISRRTARDVWMCTRRRSLAMSETNISASHESGPARSWTRSTCGCGPRWRSNLCRGFR